MAVRTVHAGTEACAASIRSIVIKEIADVSASAELAAGVTLLTKLRSLLVQQRLVVGTMYAMAKGAVFAGWIVLPEEWAAFFSMAAVAVLIDGELFQRCRAG